MARSERNKMCVSALFCNAFKQKINSIVSSSVTLAIVHYECTTLRVLAEVYPIWHYFNAVQIAEFLSSLRSLFAEKGEGAQGVLALSSGCRAGAHCSNQDGEAIFSECEQPVICIVLCISSTF